MDDIKYIIKLLERQGKMLLKIGKMLKSQNKISISPQIVKSVRDASDKKKIKQGANKYKGLVGGINFLIDHDFFKKLVSVDEIQIRLKKEGYIYPYNSVDKILRIDFVLKKKILTRDKGDGIWKYALRK